MGTRSQVFMKTSGVYLYQHWDGYNLPEEVQTALKRETRYNDEEFLSRIIFETMLSAGRYDGCSDTPEDKERTETLGYGIGTSQHGDIEWLVTVDTEKQEITINQGYDDLSQIWNGSFKEFIVAEMSEEKLMPALEA